MTKPQRLRGLRIAAAFGLLLAICACGGNSSSDDTPPPIPSVAPPAPAPTPAVAPTPAPAATTLINLSSGFMPDPNTSTGTAGGTLMASTFDPHCRGNLPSAPQHTLMLGTDFRSLNVMVHSTSDTTLVIRTPDGSYRCDDDSGGSLNPKVSGSWGPGTYQIWVGVFAGTPTPYTIGFSELESVTASSLPLP
ncbi:MAG: hypothetical protein H6719_28730 [Sandaracinaceae bacterium]|nr:hypothetical protein [Sandaracinaceae bacterium]